MTERGWRARLDLRFEARQAHTFLASRRHEGPLAVQRPFFPEGAEVPHVYLLHPPGGLVTGDTLAVNIQVGAGAHALVTTPAAGKAYRHPDGGLPAAQRQQLVVGAGATLEWLPQETIVFAGADVELTTGIQLDDGARVIAWEIVCLGRPASGEVFDHGRCRQRWAVHRGTRPLHLERADHVGGTPAMTAPWGLAGACVAGTLLAHPVPATLMDELRAGVEDLTATARVGLTRLEGDLLVARYLGANTEVARALFVRLWTLMRPHLLGRPAVPPRVWAT